MAVRPAGIACLVAGLILGRRILGAVLGVRILGAVLGVRILCAVLGRCVLHPRFVCCAVCAFVLHITVFCHCFFLLIFNAFLVSVMRGFLCIKIFFDFFQFPLAFFDKLYYNNTCKKDFTF